MIVDNRLDYITNIHPEYIQEMTEIREMYICLDKVISHSACDNDDNIQSSARAVSLARTHLETSLQFAIKALCLCGEINNDS